jgi:hypothetical protein
MRQVVVDRSSGSGPCIFCQVKTDSHVPAGDVVPSDDPTFASLRAAHVTARNWFICEKHWPNIESWARGIGIDIQVTDHRPDP